MKMSPGMKLLASALKGKIEPRRSKELNFYEHFNISVKAVRERYRPVFILVTFCNGNVHSGGIVTLSQNMLRMAPHFPPRGS